MRLIPLVVLSLLVAIEANAQPRRTRKPIVPAKPAPAAPATAEGAPWPIETLSVVGIHNYTADQILAVAGLHPGDTAGKAEFEAARERLMATGVFATAAYRFNPA